MRTARGLWILALVTALFFGCSNNSVAPTDTAQSNLIQGQIGTSDFEITVNSGGDRHHPSEGPFLLRGSNLHYDDTLHALLVDLTVRNNGRVTHSEPIGLTFVSLLPDSVTVLNPDNDMHGAGAAIVFQFANDDGVWTPGETSLPRTVQFGVDPGVAIAFVAQLDIGSTPPPPPTGGVIAGRAWNDANKNGVIDDGEPGLAGVLITLRDVTSSDSTKNAPLRMTHTGPDGHYQFPNLRAGIYEVAKAPTALFMPTTPANIHVLLTSTNGEVSSFLDANFGCIPLVTPPPPPPFPVGLVVDVHGDFVGDKDRMENNTITPLVCATAVDDSTIQDPCSGGELRGPVTRVDPMDHTIVVMGSPVHFRDFPTDVKPGDRVDVVVQRAGNVGGWVAVTMTPWDGDHEEVRGHVEQLGADPIRGYMIRVVGVWVLVGLTMTGGH
jgi:SdrD B-like domain